MLDAYIIDRIRREQEGALQKDVRTPLQIETPRLPPAVPQPEFPREVPREEETERGSVTIDFHV